ncbi:MAG: sugar-binding protein [Planctomycetota bacterium]
MRYFAVVFSVLLLAAPRLPGDEATPQPPELTVVKLTKPAPKIDGVLDDEAWKEAGKIEKFMRTYGHESETKCRMFITYDDKNLYLAAECPEPEAQMKKLKALVTKHDSDAIWADDEVEFFLEPAGRRTFPYYQIIVNCKGVTFDTFVTSHNEHDKSWEPKYEVQVAEGKEGWAVEIALPWECFDRTETSAAEWSFNFAHVRSIGELLYWAPVFSETSHVPSLFGKLKGMPVRPLGKK